MISPDDTRITYVGGANNGAVLEALARLIQAGYDVVATRVAPAEQEVLRTAHIPTISDVAEALDDCQVVMVSAEDTDAAEELLLGEGGIIELAEPGTFILDTSFTTPSFARETHAMAAVSDLYFVDAPVAYLGEHEQPMAFVGGDAEARDILSPLFPFLATSILMQNSPGEGQMAAMISYIALAGSLMGAVEAVSLARTAGFSDTAALNALASSGGASRALIDYIPHVLTRDLHGNMTISHMQTALGTALEGAHQLDITAPTIEVAYQLFQLLALVNGGELGLQGLSLLYEDEETCAKYGLDWELAERVAFGEGDPADAANFSFEKMAGDDFDPIEFLRRVFSDDLEDDEPPPRQQRRRPPEGGPPAIGDLFSKN